MRWKRIVFALSWPLGARDVKRFGLDVLSARGFEVKAVNVARLMHGERTDGIGRPPDPADFPGYREVATGEELELFLGANRDALVVTTFGLEESTLFFYRRLKDLGVDYLQMATEHTLVPTLLNRAPSDLLRRMFRWRSIAYKAKKFALLNLPPAALGIRPPRFVLMGGLKKTPYSTRFGPDTEVIEAHTTDYDDVIPFRSSDPQSPGGKRTCVFMDQNIPYHAEYAVVMGQKLPLIDPDRYYGALRRFFRHVEQRWDAEVVVAAHPRSRYHDEHPECFEGFRVERGKTLELVRDCFCAFTHHSRSSNYAFICRKPVVFLTSDDFERIPDAPYVGIYARFFGQEPVNLDRWDESALRSAPAIDPEKYDRYVADYIKVPGSPEKPVWQIVADRLSKP